MAKFPHLWKVLSFMVVAQVSMNTSSSACIVKNQLSFSLEGDREESKDNDLGSETKVIIITKLYHSFTPQALKILTLKNLITFFHQSKVIVLHMTS